MKINNLEKIVLILFFLKVSLSTFSQKNFDTVKTHLCDSMIYIQVFFRHPEQKREILFHEYFLKKDNRQWIKHGPEIKYNQQGIITSVLHYQNGKPIGIGSYNYDLEKYTTINDNDSSVCLHGIYKSYYPNGQLMCIGMYNKGMKTGEWKEYFSNGQLKSVGEYEDSILILFPDYDVRRIFIANRKFQKIDSIPLIESSEDSLLRSFHLNRSNVFYPYNLYFKTGIWRYYDEKGKLIKEEYYEKGKLIRINRY
ncbi:MAG: hypothetical protein KatS3mg035_2219 [Bacteroidia bacterium]|nr:MAG: hypothetical protein KatS3mg027_2680 [Bacteroidia bacterium]GIV28872.1 MAG: hypothetical protein KatS3mg027_2686 [Bacteroidia bacterium]GIV28895.1 MAG: hypothetical protein KatS3mg027_2709 [Bacteroidia bacterium]GIV45096.1 MAG: hypothetical protein KatS3mg035_2219 [Bacteroidia bacterium]